MDEMQFMGYLISALMVLGGFIGLIIKFIQPINKLNVTIQQLIDTMANLKEQEDKQDKKLEKHDEQIDDLQGRMNTVETKIKIYHHDN